MHQLLSWFVAALAIAAAAPANAAWHEARSEHFIIYADQDPQRLRDFATRLERFDGAVRIVMHMQDPPVGDGNRLTVFVLPKESMVRKLMGDTTGFVSGFYRPRASGSLAFVPRKAGGDSEWDFSAETIFFHEYAHHLMFQELERPYPEWMVEGFAEFMSTARFERDGSVLLGAAAQHRAYGLALGRSLSLETLLAANYSKISKEERESIYGRGWLLTHYLAFEPSRSGQIDRYLDGVAEGKPPLESARLAFGDLGKLDRDLRQYMNRGQLMAMKLSAERTASGPIDVRRMTDGGAAVVLLRARSKNGVDQATAEPLAAEVRAVQARFPGDELVETTLAEAELDAGHAQSAETAADRALKANPRNPEAMIQKAKAIARRTDGVTENRHAAFEEVRRWLMSANKIDTEDPEPLMEYYLSFLGEGVRPTRNAIEALHYASNLAPQDISLRLNSALQHLRDEQLDEARVALVPIAYNPHGGDAATLARRIIDKIDAGDGPGALKAAASGAVV